MSFSCTIKAGKKDLTPFRDGEEEIHCQLFGLGPNGPNSTDAPYRLDDIRGVISQCAYGDRLKEAAQDCFREIQRMARKNLESLTPDKHCETCQCPATRMVPNGWDAESIEKLLAIDPATITYVRGGW